VHSANRQCNVSVVQLVKADTN